MDLYNFINNFQNKSMEKFIIISLISDLTLFLTDDYNLSYILINYIKNHLKCIVRN